MISVEEAVAAILDGAAPLETETVSPGACAGRVTAEDIIARMTQPPFAASAMDGYAVRFDDAQQGGTHSWCRCDAHTIARPRVWAGR